MQLGHLWLVGLHDQRAVVVEELGDGFGELGLPLLFGFAADERQLQRVLVIEAAGGEGTQPQSRTGQKSPLV